MWSGKGTDMYCAMDLRCIEVMLQQYECHFVFVCVFLFISILFCFQILLAGGKVD